MMYQTFINYDEEYFFYADILNEYNCRSLVELGCGTGSLASRFIENGFNYTGLDLSNEMLARARRNNPMGSFVQGDMRNFQLAKKARVYIIAGRTISYLLSDEDVLNAFQSINANLDSSGIFCFDCIDSTKFIPLIRGSKKIHHTAEFNNRKFWRDSIWTVNNNHKHSFDWHSVFFEEKVNGQLQKLGEDFSVLRTFNKKEIIVFLNYNGFEVNEIIDRPSYAFDTFVIVAEKKQID